ncbi:MAG: UDP-3-O-[3-hydroxymyristoyl] glucosamine N-acyltransferase [Flavobacteriales bacterium]|jgi:UDP-3-O-[3-hydroxymyristoyl] glucosamine N-acyltransferase
MARENKYKLSELALIVDGEFRGDADTELSSLADLRAAGEQQLSFLSSDKYEAYLLESRAGAVLLKNGYEGDFTGNTIFVPDPYLAYAKLSALFTLRSKRAAGIHPSAVIESGAKISDSAAIGPNCFVGHDAVIHDNVELYAGVAVGERCVIGEGSTLYNNVVLYHDVLLGDRVAIHANTTIGSDGFGYAPSKAGWQKIHQLGTVIIGSDVEIGANTAIDRGAIENTIIDDGVIIDNQVHIAHNVRIGKRTAIAGCVGIAGSTRLGENCAVAGMVAINGHINVADNTVFHGGTIVTRGNSEGGQFASAAPLQDVDQWRKNSVRVRQLDKLFRRVKKIENALKT